jgi:spore germination cell wall hydrolase CwlJ-like protein
MAVTPWFIAIGLVLSITAEAGQDPSVNGVAIARSYEGANQNRILLASTASFAALASADLEIGHNAERVNFTLGSPDDLATIPDEIDPNPAVKPAGAPFPSIDAHGKGDPFIALRPGFEARKRQADPREGGRTELAPGPAEEDQDDPGSSPRQASSGSAGAPEPTAAMRAFDDGATPNIPLEIALNSSTPTPSDGVRRIIVARPGSELTVAAKSAADGKPNYAALIDPKDSIRQQRCLAEAIYFESRSEPEVGQAAVAQVVLNRVKSGDYPANVCGVVYQDRNRPFACQFSFACEGKSLRIEEPGPWAVAVRIAQDVASGASYNLKVGDAVNYHANYVLPYWASTLRRVASIGHHIFYEVRVGQN